MADDLLGQLMDYIGPAVAAYGARVLDKAGGVAAEEASDTTVSLGRRLLHRVLYREASRPAIEAAVHDTADNPGDDDFRTALRAQIKKAIAADPALAADLASLLGSTGIVIAASGTRSVAAQHISGIVVTGDSATIQR